MINIYIKERKFTNARDAVGRVSVNFLRPQMFEIHAQIFRDSRLN